MIIYHDLLLKKKIYSTWYYCILSIPKDSPLAQDTFIGFQLQKAKLLDIQDLVQQFMASLPSLVSHYFPHSNTISQTLQFISLKMCF